MTRFTDHLWDSIAGDIYPGILNHPFIKGLTSGALPREAFLHYVRQDSAYLESYGRGLALLAAKADTEPAFMMFCEHARVTRIVEQALHQAFLASEPNLPPPPFWNEMAPNGLLYTPISCGLSTSGLTMRRWPPSCRVIGFIAVSVSISSLPDHRTRSTSAGSIPTPAMNLARS